MIEIRLLCTPGCIRIAVIKQHTLIDFAIWYPGHSDGWGDIYLGRVVSHLPALGGAFIYLKANLSGFLPDNAGAKSLNEGDWVIARVTRSAQGGKGLRLDSRNLPSQNSLDYKTPQLIQAGPSPFEELAKQWSQASIILADLTLTSIIPTSYKPRIKIAKDQIDPDILQQIDSLEFTEIDLPMGMKATITPTPALTAIDMDSATQSNENQSKLRAQFNANLVALPPLLHQLKLRNLSGAIIVDMAGLPIKKRRLFQKDFENSLQDDPLHPKFLGFTNLGLAEITRPRKRPPLHELLYSDHGRIIQILADLEEQFNNIPNHHQYRRIKLIINIALYQALQNDTWAVNHFEQRCSVLLNIESNPSFSKHQWEYHYDQNI